MKKHDLVDGPYNKLNFYLFPSSFCIIDVRLLQQEVKKDSHILFKLAAVRHGNSHSTDVWVNMHTLVIYY